MEKIQCLIIGSGPAGYTAAIYASRANLNPVVYEGMQRGGQLTITDMVENYPGFPEALSGLDLMEKMRAQVVKFGVEIRSHLCVECRLDSAPYWFKFEDSSEVEADSVIIATGASAKFLGLPDEKKYMGQGVSACATCDGFFYRKRIVAVVGGGDTACGEALYLAGLAKKVYIIVRKPYLRASKILQQRVEENEKIEILYETNTEGLYGEDGVEGAHVVYRRGETDERHYDLQIDGFFLAIGHKPNSDVFKPWVETDETGYIKINNHLQVLSNKTGEPIPGVYAAGDIADPDYRQAIVAAGSGCKAAIEAERYLNN
ncbi:MAG: thioredoxin-disulfide reductase [Prevotellaceae bacterium]|nr:thioredoxin-disulfide reductase [Candidatus Colivivens equi]